MFSQSTIKPKGFTLIEILVTISIIGLLTMVGITNFRVASQKARDGRRQGDLEQIKAALELYRTDEGEYPGSITPGATIESAAGTVYMNVVPDDPLSGQDYYYSSGTDTYTLCAALELDTSGSCAGSCGTGVTCNYQITSPL